MAKCRVALVAGSLRKDSFNRQLARAIERLAPPELEFEHPEIGDLPLYNPSVRRLKAEIAAVPG